MKNQLDCCELRKHFLLAKEANKVEKNLFFFLVRLKKKSEKLYKKISCQIQFFLNQVESEELAVVSMARIQTSGANKKERKELEDLWPITCFDSRRLNFSHDVHRQNKLWTVNRDLWIVIRCWSETWFARRLTKSRFIKMLLWCLSLNISRNGNAKKKEVKRNRDKKRQELLWKTLQNINHNSFFLSFARMPNEECFTAFSIIEKYLFFSVSFLLHHSKKLFIFHIHSHPTPPKECVNVWKIIIFSSVFFVVVASGFELQLDIETLKKWRRKFVWEKLMIKGKRLSYRWRPLWKPFVCFNGAEGKIGYPESLCQNSHQWSENCRKSQEVVIENFLVDIRKRYFFVFTQTLRENHCF